MHQYIQRPLFAFCLFLSLAMYAQEKNESVEQIINKASQTFNAKEYFTYNINYKLFSDYTSKKATDAYDGFLLKKDNVYYYKIKNTEFIGFREYSVKVSNDEKAILIGKKGKDDFPLNLNTYLKAFKSKLIKSDNATWICELVPDKVSQIMFSKIIMAINKKDYSVSKQVLYFLNTSPEDSNAQRLEITFTPRNKDLPKDNALVDQSKYFIKSGSTIKVAPRLKEYQLYKDQN